MTQVGKKGEQNQGVGSFPIKQTFPRPKVGGEGGHRGWVVNGTKDIEDELTKEKESRVFV